MATLSVCAHVKTAAGVPAWPDSNVFAAAFLVMIQAAAAAPPPDTVGEEDRFEHKARHSCGHCQPPRSFGCAPMTRGTHRRSKLQHANPARAYLWLGPDLVIFFFFARFSLLCMCSDEEEDEAEARRKKNKGKPKEEAAPPRSCTLFGFSFF